MNPAPYVAPQARFRITQELAVSWFDARQLIATAGKTITATVVGSMSGRREIMAALDPDSAQPPSLADRDEMWLDFLADCGDGWNASVSIAWLVGRDGLTIAKDGSPSPQPVPADCFTEAELPASPLLHALPHGEVLIAGGDEVYPTASSEGYQHRLIDPLRCARYSQSPERTIYAIPGNHDWYDGLTSFLRLFCQTGDGRRWLGAWRTQQRRSYFAIELPHRTWLWGVDMALEDDLDPPQQAYFEAQSGQLKPGDQVILCVPSPSWVHAQGMDPDLDRTELRMSDKLHIIMDLARGGAGCPADVPVVLSGDLHYYARHETTIGGRPRHYIICGGGGAFGLGTLQSPQSVRVTEIDGEDVAAERRATYPDAARSTQLRNGVLRFPLVNWAFSFLLAIVQLVGFWVIGGRIPDADSAAACGRETDRLLHAMCAGHSLSGLVSFLGEAGMALARPAPAMWLLAVLAGFMGFAGSSARKQDPAAIAYAAGLVHGLLQVIGSFCIIWAAAALTGAWLGPNRSGAGWLAIAMALPAMYAYCGFLFGLYLFAGHLWLHLHDQEVYSAQAIQDFKSFLRIRIGADGVTIYPIGLDRVARDWKAAPGVTTADAGRTGWWMARRHAVEVPAGCTRVMDPAVPLAPRLIEAPIHIARRQ